MQVAKTIATQIGSKTLYMIGAKNLGATANSLQFKIMRNAKKITHIIVTLKADDTYKMEFLSCRGASRKVIKEVNGIYCDMMNLMILENTGLYTNL